MLDSKTVELLVRQIYSQTKLKYVTVGDTIYRQRNNVWAESEVEDENADCCEASFPEYNEDEKCPHSQPVEAKGPITYVMDYGTIGTRIAAVEDYPYEDYTTQQKQNVLRILQRDLDAVLFNHPIVVEHDHKEPNTDHRGSDHTAIILPFKRRVGSQRCTLRHFIDALYMIKSHKFDHNYEMFLGCKCETVLNDNLSPRETHIIVNFDYGS